MLAATLIAIFIIPVCFYIVEKFFVRHPAHAEPPADAGGPPVHHPES
jgi:predicted GNAT family acetyltransferase